LGLLQDEARELGRLGGIKSGEVRREKKRMADIYAAVLARKYGVDKDGNEITGANKIEEVIATILERQDTASVSMIKELREGIDGNKVEHSGAVDMTRMSDEEFEAKSREILESYLADKE